MGTGEGCLMLSLVIVWGLLSFHFHGLYFWLSSLDFS